MSNIMLGAGSFEYDEDSCVDVADDGSFIDHRRSIRRRTGADDGIRLFPVDERRDVLVFGQNGSDDVPSQGSDGV